MKLSTTILFLSKSKTTTKCSLHYSHTQESFEGKDKYISDEVWLSQSTVKNFKKILNSFFFLTNPGIIVQPQAPKLEPHQDL